MADPKTIIPTQVLRLPMRAAEIASVRVLDTDLIVILKSGQRVTIRDGALRAMIDNNLRIAFADVEVRAADLLKQVGSVRADALSELSVASKEATDAPVVGKTPNVNAAANPLDGSNSNAEHIKTLTELVSKQQTQIDLLSRQLENFSASIDGTLSKISPPASVSPVPAAAKSGFLASISPAWGALGALGALGGKSAAPAAPGPIPSDPVSLLWLSITGDITFGPILPTNQLRVAAYDRNGRILGSDETVDAVTGAYEIKILNGYSGLVILKVYDGNPNAPDYMDEATRTALSVDKPEAPLGIRALVVTDGIVPKVAHINPLTELVALKLGMASGVVETGKSSSEILSVSKALAHTLELSSTGQLLSDIEVIPTIHLDGSTNPNANKAGQLLDTISQIESLNNYTGAASAITTVAAHISDVIDGVAGFADPNITNLTQFQTALLQTPPKIAGVAFSVDTGVSNTDLITSDGIQDMTITFSKALDNSRTLSWKTTDAEVWSSGIAGNGTNTLVFSGVTLPNGSKTLQFRFTNTATSLSEAAQVNADVNLVYTIDTMAPPTPVVVNLAFSVDNGSSATDRITNEAAQTVTGTITTPVDGTDRIWGSVDGGATWSLITSRTTNSSSGQTSFSWNVAALSNQTASGIKSLVFQLQDTAGNISSSAAIPYVLDTTLPDNSISLASITISSDTGIPDDFRTGTKRQTITASLTKVLNNTATNGETLWGSVDNGVTWTSLNSSIANLQSGGRHVVWSNVDLIEGDHHIVFKITDVAGNTLDGLGRRSYFLETPPPPPTLTLHADTGVIANDRITNNGRFDVTDILPGHTWEYSLNHGTTWTAGSANFFIAPQGSYEAGAIQLRQISGGGVNSAVDQTSRSTTIDSSAAVPSLALASDTGNSNSDFITKNGTMLVTGLEAGATWRYKIGSGMWQSGGVVENNSSSFVLPSSGLAGTTYVANTILVEQTDLAGNTSAIVSYGNGVTVRTTPPVQSISGLRISADSGTLTTGFYSANASTQNSDWLTNTASQTITATLNSTLAVGDLLMGSVDNGVSFASLNQRLTGTSLNWSGVNLDGNSSILLKVVDIAGNESVLINQAYKVDTTGPSVALAEGATIAFNNDTGSSGTDFYTSNNQQRIQTELTRSLMTSGDDVETLWASTNTGTSWVNITSYLNGTKYLNWDMESSGTTLTLGAHSLVLKVTDKAGNASTIANVAYTLDTTVDTPTSGLDTTDDTFGTLNGVTVGTASDGITNQNSHLIYSGVAEIGATSVSVTLNGQTRTAATVGSSAGASLNSLNGAYWVTFDGPLMDGIYTPTIVVTDKAGNSNTIAFTGTPFRVDTLANTMLDGQATTPLLGQLTPTQTSFSEGNDTGVLSDNITRTTSGLVYGGTVEAGAAVSVVINGVTYSTIAHTHTGAYAITTNSTPLLAGTYTPSVTVTDLSGNTSTSLGTAFTVDTAAPNLVVAQTNATLSTDGWINAAERTAGVALSGTTEAGRQVSIATGTGTDVIVTAHATTGAWSATVPSANLPESGSVTFTVTSTDAAGNTATVTRTVNVDTAAPSLIVTQTNATIATDGTINAAERTAGVVLSGTTEAGRSVTIATGTGTDVIVTADASTGAWSATVPSANLPESGSVTFTVTSSDAAGNTATVTRTASVDTTAPDLVVTQTNATIATDGTINAAERTAGVVLSGTTEAGRSVTIATGTGTDVTVTADASTGQWSATVPADNLPSNGNVTFTVTSSDAAGNTASVTRTATVDTTAPNLVVTQTNATIATDGWINAAERTAGVVLSGTTEAGRSVTIATGTGTDVMVTADASTGEWSTTLQADNLPSNGNVTFTVTSSDAAGNTATVTRSATVDTAAPDLVVTQTNATIASDGTINAAERTAGVVLSGTTEAGRQVNISTGTGTDVTVTSHASTGAWSATVPAANLPESGSVTFTVTSSDAAGNTASVTRTATVDTTAPDLVVTQTNAMIATDGTINAAERTAGVVLSGTTEAGRSVTIATGAGADVTVTAHASTGAWSATVPAANLPESGSVTFTVTSSDAAGNTATVTRTATVDTTAPNLVVTQTNATIATDGWINPAERTAGVVLSGTTEAGRQVNISTGTGADVTVTAHASTGEWSATVPAANLPTNGSVTFTVTSSNTLGNTATVIRTATVDTTAPVAPLLALGHGVVGGATRAEATQASGVVTVTAESGATATVTFSRSGWTVTKTLIGTGSAQAVSLTSADLATVSDGLITVRATQVDAAGNAQTVTFSSTTFNLDTVVPEFTSPTSVTVLENNTANFYNAHTTQGDSGMTYTLSGTDGAVFNFLSTNGNLGFRTTPDFESPQDSDGNNVYEFTVRATDSAGNFTDSFVTLTVTDVKPTPAELFAHWESEGFGGEVTPPPATRPLQNLSVEIVSQFDVTNAAGTANGANPLTQYINRVTGTDIVSDAELEAGFTIHGKAAPGAQGSLRFFLDNDRTDGIEELGTELTQGSQGVSWTYNNSTGDYTISFAADSAALKQATHNTFGSGVHKLSVDTNGNAALDAGEASRLFLVASGTARTTDTGLVSQNFSVLDRPSGNVFVYHYSDPDVSGIGIWTMMDRYDQVGNPSINTASRDSFVGDFDYYNNPSTAIGTTALTTNTQMGFFTVISAQVWEFQIAESPTTGLWSAANSHAGDHTAWGSNTSRLPSLQEALALYAANFGGTGSNGGSTVGAVQPMTNTIATSVVSGENNLPTGWADTLFWTAAPAIGGYTGVDLRAGAIFDNDNNVSGRLFVAVL